MERNIDNTLGLEERGYDVMVQRQLAYSDNIPRARIMTTIHNKHTYTMDEVTMGV